MLRRPTLSEPVRLSSSELGSKPGPSSATMMRTLPGRRCCIVICTARQVASAPRPVIAVDLHAVAPLCADAPLPLQATIRLRGGGVSVPVRPLRQCAWRLAVRAFDLNSRAGRRDPAPDIVDGENV